MSLTEEILKELLKPTLYYKGIQVNLFGFPKFKTYTSGTIRSTVWDMKKRGFIEKRNSKWCATPTGKKFLQRKIDLLKQFQNNFSKDTSRNLLVMYDIPESKKAEREWFRWHLKKFNFIMIQRSVWVGPSPLPKPFEEYLKKIKLRECLKTFKLAKPYESKKNQL